MKKNLQCEWSRWRRVTRVICNRRVFARMKRKICKAVVRPAMYVVCCMLYVVCPEDGGGGGGDK